MLHYDFFLFRSILDKVFSLPRISIISATPGPSLSPLSKFRRVFIKLLNVRLFLVENCLSIVCKSTLLKLPASKSAINESRTPGDELNKKNSSDVRINEELYVRDTFIDRSILGQFR